MKLTSLRLLGGTLLFASLAQLASGNPLSVASAASVRSAPVARAASSPYQAALAAYKAGNWKAAEKQFRLAISRHDHIAQSYNGLGNAAMAIRDYPTAYKAFKTVAALAPNDPYIQYHAAYAALYAAYYHDAVRFATNVIRLQPKNWRGYHLRFLAYGNLLQPKAQVKDATVVVQLDSKDASAWNDLGIAMTQIKQYKSAIDAETKAIHLSPNNPAFYMNRGVTENLAKQSQDSLRDLKKARSLTTDPALQKKLDAAIQYLEKRGHK